MATATTPTGASTSSGTARTGTTTATASPTSAATISCGTGCLRRWSAPWSSPWTRPWSPGATAGGNRQYDYIEGHTVIDQANAIFGYGGWGYDLAGDVSLRRIEKVDVSTGEVKVNYAYSAPVRVSVVNGAPPRTDIGFHVVTEDTPEGHETAAKGAVTDGLKRALRSFGDRFGNGLYGDQPAANNRPRAQRSDGPANANGNSGQGNNGNWRREGSYLQQLRGRLIALGAEQGFGEDQVRDAVKKQTGKDLDDLPARDLKPLVEGAARKVNEAKEAERGNGNG